MAPGTTGHQNFVIKRKSNGSIEANSASSSSANPSSKTNNSAKETTATKEQPNSSQSSNGSGGRMISLKTSYEPIKDKVNGKVSASIKKSGSLPASESSGGADDSLGSVASDEISPKRLRRSSSRSLSPQTHRSSSERSKRIKAEDAPKVCSVILRSKRHLASNLVRIA